ncbi:MAG: hypothetical protein SR1Q5_00125 [Quinella sp. 1Q5]|nr:hypothetical protein [Quinella sp. 1Q5]
MKIYPDTKIYILAPGNYSSGGPESLHQLCSQLLNCNVKACMYYVPSIPKIFNPDNPVHENFTKYHLPYVLEVEDDKRNIIIIPESLVEYHYRTKKIRRVLWWLSVNIYIRTIRDLMNKRFLDPLSEPMPKFFYFYRKDEGIDHWTQSEYVRQFLELNGVKNSTDIETPMSHNFLSQAAHIDLSKKENIVAFNPKKDPEIAKRIITEASDIDWRRIENMTPEEVQTLLTKAKVYMDFGYFPGRERLPREAALLGCVVITGKRGASGNDIDVNIPAEFKFDTDTLNPKQVVEKIRDVFENFSTAHESQKAFRDKEINAPKVFKSKVVEYFEIKELPLPSVAFVQGVSEESLLLAKGLLKNNFKPSFIIDDEMALTESDKRIFREQGRNYLRLDNELIEIVTRDDAKFLYLEGRIKKFALLEPSDAELDAMKDFYGADVGDLLIFSL